VKLSIVVPAYNEEKLLGATLDCIRKATAGLPAEIIVCDNNSTDRTAEIARQAGARVVFEPVNQIARARNAGAAQASGDWLVFVDADSSPTKELFRDVVAAIDSPTILAGGSTVRLEAVPAFVRFWVGAWNALSRLNRWAAGSFIFCEAAAFRELGGFDEKFYASEEIDFSRRARRLARRRGREMVILHRHPLLTSGRKAKLYSPGEFFGFLVKTIITGGRTLRRKDDCYAWYDGRR
jgi:glycosyltransferase involved in cell wall biosynthesis